MRFIEMKLLSAMALILALCAGAMAQKEGEKDAEIAALSYRLLGAEDRGADHYVIQAGATITLELRLPEPAQRVAIVLSLALEHGVLDRDSAQLIFSAENVPAGTFRITRTVPAELAGNAFILQAGAQGRSGREYRTAAMTLMIAAPIVPSAGPSAAPDEGPAMKEEDL